MWNKIVAWWDSLPHGVQAVIVTFFGAVAGFVVPIIQNWAAGQPVCGTNISACLKTDAISAIKVGVSAVIGLYIKSSLYHKQP